MSNTNLTIDWITREALRIAHEKSTFLGTVDRQYDEEFGKAGSKIGNTLRIRKPSRFVRRKGSRVMDVQDTEDEKTTLVLSIQDGVDMRVNSAEMYLDKDDFSKRYIEPAIAVLMSGVESDVLQAVTKKVYNQVGTWGTPPTDLAPFGLARAYLNQDLAPKDDNRFIQYDSVNMGGIVNNLKGLFHDSSAIKEQYREGMMGRTAGFDWYENERILNHTTGSDHTTVTVNDASIAEGDTGFTTAGANVTVGTVFTIANVNKVHPETKTSLGRAQQFVITAVNGNDWTFSPAYYAAGAKQNVDALPVNGAAITLFGTASQTKAQALAYHKEAFSFVTGDLPLMADAVKCVRQNFEGIALRVWQGSDIKNDELLTRIDILYGYEAIRPEWACRISM